VKILTWNTIYPKVVRIAWGLLFFTLPVTSFPFFPAGLGGKTLVRPLSIYPLIILVILITIPRLLRRPLPRTFLPIFAFVVVAMISSIAAFSSDLEAFRGVTMTSRFIRNVVTLGLGMAFYLTVTLLPETWEDIRFSLRWLYAGFILALLWGTIQIPYVVHYSSTYFKWINNLQGLISTRKLFTTRISGLTYEPKWFAEQICFLLIPWLLGAILSRRSIFAWRYKWVTVEWLLLAWSVVVLVFTYSRTGLFILAILVLLGYFLFRFYTQEKLVKKKKPPKRTTRRILEIAAVFVGLVCVIVVIGSQNPYFSRLWRYWTEAKTRNRSYLEYIAFEQRFVYWQTAFRTYEVNPLIGVGLGNYAFYFDEMLPNQPWFLQKEIIRQITPSEGRDRLITPKNLYARLLAETGLLGTVTFTAFVLAIMGCILLLLFSQSPDQRYWGMSAALAMVVFVITLFSSDSFALPNMWVFFGLTTAAAHLADPTQKSAEAS
jgi:O-antigen ligase